MLTADVSKIKKSVLSNITFSFNLILEDEIIFAWMSSYFFRSKSNVISQKRVFSKAETVCVFV